MRQDLRIPSGDGELAAWLYRPREDEPAPLVVLAHGLSGTREDGLAPFAERIAAAGIAALVFDYRHLGASSGQPRQLIDVRRQYEDYDSALAYARTLPDIDPRRLAVWGTSFSGGHAISAAARNDVAAAVAMVPFADGLYESLRIPLRRRIPLAAAAVRDLLPRSEQPAYVRVGGPAGSRSVIADDEAWASWQAIVGEASLWRNEVVARFSLQLIGHRPVKDARRVRCPLLVQIAGAETVIHNKPAERAARQAPRGQLISYPGLHHFDGYTGDGFERTVTDQIAFLTRHLAPVSTTR